MKIRTQLVLALSTLAVLPLTTIVLYSYVTSLRAVRAAEEAEAALKVSRLEQQLELLQAEFGRRVRTLDGLNMADLMPPHSGSPDSAMARPLAERVLYHLGDAAPIVSRLEFVPMVPAAPTAPTAATPSGNGDAALEGHVSEIQAVSVTAVAGTLAPMVIDVGEALEALEIEMRETGWGEPSEVDVGNVVRFIGTAMESAGVDSETLNLNFTEAMDEGFDDEWVFSDEGFVVPVMEGESRVGGLRIGIGDDQLARAVLSRPLTEREGDLTFAFDETGELYLADDTVPEAVAALAREAVAQGGGSQFVSNEYVVVTTSPDAATGLSFAVARPLEPVLAGVRSAAVRNLLSGLGLILLAVVGVLPLASRMTRNLDSVIAGVERVAQGDLNVRVPVRSQNEFGRLAEAVNSMAVELLDQEVRLVEQAREGQEREVRERLLQSDYERKSQELEEARRFQLSLLPKELPDHPHFEVAVSMQTAAEVGGDYYDFQTGPDDELTVAIGDATGHGARAGTMVTVIKSLFSAHSEGGPSAFLDAAGAAIRRMDLGRMLMALTVARLQPGRLILSAAGMPPVLLHRAANSTVVELSLAGMPLGGMAWQYEERSVDIAVGDTLLFLSDGFPEATDPDGNPFGYENVSAAFAAAVSGSASEIVDHLLAASAEWRAGEVVGDDLTLVVVRVT